jgi:hypothetical protein
MIAGQGQGYVLLYKIKLKNVSWGTTQKAVFRYIPVKALE